MFNSSYFFLGSLNLTPNKIKDKRNNPIDCQRVISVNLNITGISKFHNHIRGNEITINAMNIIKSMTITIPAIPIIEIPSSPSFLYRNNLNFLINLFIFLIFHVLKFYLVRQFNAKEQQRLFHIPCYS